MGDSHFDWGLLRFISGGSEGRGGPFAYQFRGILGWLWRVFLYDLPPEDTPWRGDLIYAENPRNPTRPSCKHSLE